MPYIFFRQLFLENSFLRQNCKVDREYLLAFSLSHPPHLFKSQQVSSLVHLPVTILVLKNRQFHLHFQKGHFIQNSYRVFGETSKQFSHGILASSFVTESQTGLVNVAVIGYSSLSRLRNEKSMYDLGELRMNLKRNGDRFYWFDSCTTACQAPKN